jgi:hypothetical protein
VLHPSSSPANDLAPLGGETCEVGALAELLGDAEVAITSYGMLRRLPVLAKHGVDRSRIQSWLQADVLERTGERGVYRATARTAKKLRDYLAALER